MRRRRLTWSAMAMALSPLVVACAAVPTSGPIYQGEDVGVEEPNQVIRVIARPPRPGMTPTEIVSGFIEASASFEDDHAVARQYLTPSAALTWDAAAGSVVYEGVPTVVPDGLTTVGLTATETGRISVDGRYQVAATGRIIDLSFTVEFLNGEWRIANPPPGLLLSRSDVDRAYRPYDVFFFDPTYQTLVPDSRLFPLSGPSAATALVRALVAGPSGWLAPAVRSSLPEGTTLAVDAVPVIEGIARVDFDPAVRLADDATRQAISAQVVWTLRQAPGVRFIDINAGGQPLDVPGAANPQPINSWPDADPNSMPAGATPHGVVFGRAVKLDGTAPLPVPGGSGLASPPLTGIAVSLDTSLVAGLDADARLWIAPVSAGSTATLAIDEVGLSRPSFGGGESPWVVNSEGSVLRAEPDGTTYTVPIDGLSAKATVESIAISRDGTRAALIVRRGERSFVMVAVIALREGQPRLQSPVRVDNRLNSVTDVAWADSDTLAVLGADGAATPAVYLIDMARLQVRSIGAPAEPVRVGAAPGAAILSSTVEGWIYTFTNGPWLREVRATSPAYPGS